MEASTDTGPISREDWQHLCDTNIGSGSKLDYAVITRTHEIFTGYELIEAFCGVVKTKPFSLASFVTALNGDLKEGLIVMDEHPTPNNQFWRFHYAKKVSGLVNRQVAHNHLIRFFGRVQRGEELASHG